MGVSIGLIDHLNCINMNTTSRTLKNVKKNLPTIQPSYQGTKIDKETRCTA